jgi:hypothetical protein
MKPYKNLYKRIENEPTGMLGRIVEATRKPGSTVWDIAIKFDREESRSKHWDTASMFRYNRIVPEDYAPDHGPIKERIEAVISRLEKEPIPFRFGHSTVVYVGKDEITLSRDSKYWINVTMWAGQRNWQTMGDTVQEATSAMVDVLSATMITDER